MRGPKLATIAWRNLWRHRRRTILTLVSIAFGGFMAVLITSMQDRSFSDFIDTAARMGGGHVTIQHPEYLDTPSLTRTITDTASLHRLATADPRVGRVVDRISGQTMLATANDSFGAAFIAYDPAAEDESSLSFLEGLVEGEWYQTADDPGIILGKKLASNLGAELGDRVVYTLIDRHGEIVAGLGRLSGIIGTGAPSADASLCLLPIDRVRHYLGYAPDEATQVAVFLSDSRRSVAVRDSLNQQISAQGQRQAVALTWDEITPDLRSFISMKVGGGRVMELFIALLVAAGIFNTIFVSVMERMREFGIMMAIGYSPGQISRMVMWESLWLALVGLVSAFLITLWPYSYLAKHGIDLTEQYSTSGQGTEIGGVGFDMVMHVGIYPENAIIIACAILFATLAAGVYPAWRAGRINPVDTIKLV